MTQTLGYGRAARRRGQSSSFLSALRSMRSSSALVRFPALRCCAARVGVAGVRLVGHRVVARLLLVVLRPAPSPATRSPSPAGSPASSQTGQPSRLLGRSRWSYPAPPTPEPPHATTRRGSPIWAGAWLPAASVSDSETDPAQFGGPAVRVTRSRSAAERRRAGAPCARPEPGADRGVRISMRGRVWGGIVLETETDPAHWRAGPTPRQVPTFWAGNRPGNRDRSRPVGGRPEPAAGADVPGGERPGNRDDDLAQLAGGPGPADVGRGPTCHRCAVATLRRWLAT